jgi:hypothetical protein
MKIRTTVEVGSECNDYFGHENFDTSRIKSTNWTQCPVKGCAATLAKIERTLSSNGKIRVPLAFCATHGIRLHAGTFVYWNGSARQDGSRLRNFQFQPELARTRVLGKSLKVESGRLGSEMSEDALSWNVFVGLAEAGKLKQTLEFLTGRTVRDEPDLYLWGIPVRLDGASSGRYAPLERVRTQLESDIGNYKTEPDIMLVVPNELVVCIEAKFGSGNPLAHASTLKDGDKPTERAALLSRYLDRASDRTRKIIASNEIGAEFHSQLFRNVIFASEMAGEADWHVVNLVSSTQWKQKENLSSPSFASPVGHVRSYLKGDHHERFDFRTWEGMHMALISGVPSLAKLDEFMKLKSAHFVPAFELSP